VYIAASFSGTHLPPCHAFLKRSFSPIPEALLEALMPCPEKLCVGRGQGSVLQHTVTRPWQAFVYFDDHRVACLWAGPLWCRMPCQAAVCRSSKLICLMSRGPYQSSRHDWFSCCWQDSSPACLLVHHLPMPWRLHWISNCISSRFLPAVDPVIFLCIVCEPSIPCKGLSVRLK